MISRHAHDYATFVVRATLARYLSLPPDSVLSEHHLEHDLGLDGFDLALVASMLEEALELELPERGIEEDMRVCDVAAVVARAGERETSPVADARAVERRATAPALRHRRSQPRASRRPHAHAPVRP